MHVRFSRGTRLLRRVALVVVAASVGGVAACAGDDITSTEGYTYALSISFDGSDLAVEVDGEPVAGEPSGNGTHIVYEREIDDPETATPVAVSVIAGDEVVTSLELSSVPCTQSSYPSCGPIVRAERALCFFADGEPKGLCGALSCYDAGGHCGGWVSRGPRD